MILILKELRKDIPFRILEMDIAVFSRKIVSLESG